MRDLVVHVAAWAEHGAAALELAASGRGADFAYSKAETDAMNERILADGRSTSPAGGPRPRGAWLRGASASESRTSTRQRSIGSSATATRSRRSSATTGPTTTPSTRRTCGPGSGARSRMMSPTERASRTATDPDGARRGAARASQRREPPLSRARRADDAGPRVRPALQGAQRARGRAPRAGHAGLADPARRGPGRRWLPVGASRRRPCSASATPSAPTSSASSTRACDAASA